MVTGGVDGREHPDARTDRCYVEDHDAVIAELDTSKAALLVRVETTSAALADARENEGTWKRLVDWWAERAERLERERDEAQAALRRVTELCDERSARAPEDALVDQDDAALGWFARHILAAIQASPTPEATDA